MGAWIETIINEYNAGVLGSRPVWARGLKLGGFICKYPYFMSRPVWARGLKHYIFVGNVDKVVSRPVWARGLKQMLLV